MHYKNIYSLDIADGCALIFLCVIPLIISCKQNAYLEPLGSGWSKELPVTRIMSIFITDKAGGRVIYCSRVTL